MDNNKKADFWDSAAEKSGGKIDGKTIKNAIKNGDSKQLLDKLSSEDKQKLNEILSDKQALNNILKSPLAMELLRRFGGDKNG